MERTEAFEILGLDSDVSEEEIWERYRYLVLERHPDQGGSTGEMDRLEEAKRVALGESPEIQLRSESAIKEYAQQSVELAERRKDTEKILNHLITRNTSRHRRLRQRAAIFSGLSGFIALLNRFVLDDWRIIELFELYLWLIMLTAAMGAIYAHYMVDNIKTTIKELEADLDEKTRFIQLLDELGIEYGSTNEFTRSEFDDIIQDWLSVDSTEEGNSSSLTGTSSQQRFHSSNILKIYRRMFFAALGLMPRSFNFRTLATIVGEQDFSRLLIRKGLELQVFEEIEQMEDGEWTIKYRINTPGTQ